MSRNKKGKSKAERDEPLDSSLAMQPEDNDVDVDAAAGIDGDDEYEDDMQSGKRGGSRGSGWEEIFGETGLFGRDGPFGANGPFGPQGPFGRSGPFGNSGPFAGRGGDRMGGRMYEARGGRMREARGGRMREARSGQDGQPRAKRMFAQGELRLALLVLIAERSRHGYECIKDIEEMTGGSYAPSPGAVYPTLQMLADEGLIEEAKGEGAKKPFKATDDGLAELSERKDEVQKLMSRLAIRGKRTRDAGSPDMMRALGNLASVLTNKATDGKLSKANKDEIVDIIDEVAKRIERL